MQMQELNEGSHEGLESSIVVKGNLVVNIVVAAVIVAVEKKLIVTITITLFQCLNYLPPGQLPGPPTRAPFRTLGLGSLVSL